MQTQRASRSNYPLEWLARNQFEYFCRRGVSVSLFQYFRDITGIPWLCPRPAGQRVSIFLPSLPMGVTPASCSRWLVAPFYRAGRSLMGRGAGQRIAISPPPSMMGPAIAVGSIILAAAFNGTYTLWSSHSNLQCSGLVRTRCDLPGSGAFAFCTTTLRQNQAPPFDQHGCVIHANFLSAVASN